jgi:leader peptidase (prepilin peptidase) / N-methyltransferase
MIMSFELTGSGAAAYMLSVCFVFGACVGSFLNVCIYRIPRDESVVRPRSHCPGCNTMIAWYDNVPIFSYLVLRARCRHCSARISPRYALVELLVAVLFVLVGLQYGLGWWRGSYWLLLDARMPVYWLVASGLVVATFVDFEHYIIPDRISLGGIVAGLVLSLVVPGLHGEASSWAALQRALLGTLVGGGSLWLVGVIGKAIFKKDAMGMGDVKLLAAIGAFFGWQAVLFTIIGSSFFGSFAGVGLIVFGKKEWQSRLPYGPYIALAALLWMLGGSAWWQAYVNWVTGAV